MTVRGIGADIGFSTNDSIETRRSTSESRQPPGRFPTWEPSNVEATPRRADVQGVTRRSDGGSTALQRIPTRFTVRLVGVTAEPSYPGNVYRAVTQDAPLELVREPNNEYDANAVVVRRADTRERLGYLRANVANVLAPTSTPGRSGSSTKSRSA